CLPSSIQTTGYTLPAPASAPADPTSVLLLRQPRGQQPKCGALYRQDQYLAESNRAVFLRFLLAQDSSTTKTYRRPGGYPGPCVPPRPPTSHRAAASTGSIGPMPVYGPGRTRLDCT